MKTSLNNPKAINLILLTCLLSFLAFAAAGYPLKFRDARGKQVVIKAKPQRIVSLTPNNTEILFALGLGDRVVGVTKYCNYPTEARKKPKIGDATISAESIIALKPDLVLAHAFINDSAIPRLEKLGLTVFAIDPKTIAEVIRDIRTVGKITGRPKTADGIAANMERAVARVKASRSTKSPVKNVLVVVQSSPLWVAGPKTFVNEMLVLAGASNIAFDARPGFVTFSKELAVSRDPDVILVGLERDVGYFLTDPAWRSINAAKHKRVYVIDNDLIMRPGPRLAIGLEKLAEKLK